MLKTIYLTLIQLVEKIRLLPPAIVNVLEQRKRQAVLIELEAERLDRLRNPSKYRGK